MELCGKAWYVLLYKLIYEVVGILSTCHLHIYFVCYFAVCMRQYLELTAFWMADFPDEYVSSWKCSCLMPQECDVLGAEPPHAHFIYRVNLFILCM